MSKLRLGSDPFVSSSGVDALIQDTRPSTQKNTNNNELQSVSSKQSNTTKAGLKPGWTRATFIIKEELVEKLRDLAWWDRKDIKDVLSDALNSYLSGKTIEPRKTQ